MQGAIITMATCTGRLGTFLEYTTSAVDSKPQIWYSKMVHGLQYLYCMNDFFTMMDELTDKGEHSVFSAAAFSASSLGIIGQARIAALVHLWMENRRYIIEQSNLLHCSMPRNGT
jgi:hypothetical protein